MTRWYQMTSEEKIYRLLWICAGLMGLTIVLAGFAI